MFSSFYFIDLYDQNLCNNSSYMWLQLSSKGESSIVPIFPCHVGIGSFRITNGHFIHAGP